MRYFILLLLAFVSINLCAQDNTWIGNTGNWDVQTNWSLGTIPKENHNVKITGSSSKVTVPVAFLAVAKSLSVIDNSKLVNNGTITINTLNTFDGIYNNSSITNVGTINISNTGGAGTVGQGINNFGLFDNDGVIFMGPDIRETGIWNRTGSTFNNNNEISFTGSITVCGIDAVGGTFNNYGILDNKANTGNAFILVSGSGKFFNHPCGIINETTSEQITATHLVNSGIIRLKTSLPTTITSNSGVIANPNGSVISGTNTGSIITNSNTIVWTGCGQNGSTSNAANWVGLTSSQLADGNDHVIIPTGPMNTGNYPFTGPGLNMTSTSIIEINENASITFADINGNAIQSAGVINLFGEIIVQHSSQNGIRITNTGTLIGGANSNITVMNVEQNAIRNDGMINFSGSITTSTNVGASGINNTNEFNLSGSGEIDIIGAEGVGIINNGDFNTSGNTSVYINAALGGGFFNQDGGVVKNAGIMTINNVSNTAYLQLASSTFNNTGNFNLTGAGTATGILMESGGILVNAGCGNSQFI
ncbi:MAG: hypothetical protein IPN55_11495 [Saprospiraceae bacterium]|nr:hypothetical protein [Candidatus Brachybacter algidus]